MPRMKFSERDYARIETLLASGTHYRAIARIVGCSTALVSNVKHGRVKRSDEPLPSIIEVLGPVKTTPGDPSQEEIAEACEKLRRLRPREAGSIGCVEWSAPEIGLSVIRGGVA